MKFYNRHTEITQLQALSDNAEKGTGLLTLLVGRRRVGKTALLRKAYDGYGQKALYLFISRKQEALLCEEFAESIRQTLNIPIFGTPTRLREIMKILLEYSRTQPVTVVLDEFQDIERVNKAFFSELQDLWDSYKSESHMHLICCGSLYSAMTRLFQNSREPLFGRADTRINLQPLAPLYISEILRDTKRYSPERLLCWYMLSGGVPKYLEWLDSSDTQSDDLWAGLINSNSLILEEGNYRLAEEFGPDHGTYFSILAAIATGRTSRPEIESILETSVGPQLERLEKEFEIISRHQPVLAKTGSRLVKYRLADAFLAFWFRFIYRYRSAVEMENYAFIRKAIERDYPTWSGQWLELLIQEGLAATGQYNIIGNYWERGNRNEIDIVAINELDKTALIAEVKRNPDNIRLSHLREKAVRLCQQLKGYDIEYKGFSMNDLDKLLLNN